MKAVKNPSAQGQVQVSSFKDAGYQSAVSGERMLSVARFVFENCPAFLDDVPKETKSQLEEGWALRWQEINPAKGYSVDWIPVEGEGSQSVSLAFCLSYSQQAFGQMKSEDPVKHSIIKQVRDAFSKYKSNRMADLRTAVRRVANEGQTKTRPQAKMFYEYTKNVFDEMKARCKTALARGDSEADEVKLRMAIDAFNRVYFDQK
jgi:hypothetical protein